MRDGIDFWRLWPDLAPVAVAAAAICVALILALRPLLVRYALARPNARSSHRQPTPQGGGIAVMTATIATAALSSFWIGGIDPSALAQLRWALAASAFIAVVGAVDDIRAVSVAPRLALQALAVTIVIASLPADLHVLPFLPWWVERALLLFAGLWFVNLVNFMDGLDWMTVAEVVPATAGLVALGILGALPVHGLIAALALLGAVVGFAPFNRPVARLFLGDVGSLAIGLVLGWLLVLLAARGHLAAALLLPLYYFADTTITLVRRLANAEPVWQAHRTHFYQRATDNGFTVIAVVGHVFLVNVALASLAVAAVLIDTPAASALFLLLGAALVGWLLVRFARNRT
jgi:UDP-N-acetylmuramyl pentapeptide phosphotransferase/UDP-N-acetylglucosamine-1-phosphate transferase